MEMNNIYMAAFSPTSRTEFVLHLMADEWREDFGGGDVKEINVTPWKEASKEYEYQEQDLLCFGVPSYGGRVPETALLRLRHMRGHHTPAVIVTTFGNRAYDDTLLELKDTMEEQGFVVTAAVAAVTEHNILTIYGSGRPDDSDQSELKQFARRIREKILSLCTAQEGALIQVPGSRPYRKYSKKMMQPRADGACNHCGACAKHCPVHAIEEDYPSYTNESLCIGCMGCITVCPRNARKISKVKLALGRKMLKKACLEPKKNELYL